MIKQLFPDSEFPTLIILKNTVAGFGISYRDESNVNSAPVAPEGYLVFSVCPLGGLAFYFEPAGLPLPSLASLSLVIRSSFSKQSSRLIPRVSRRILIYFTVRLSILSGISTFAAAGLVGASLVRFVCSLFVALLYLC